MHILIISGALREGSFNRKLAMQAALMLPEGVTNEIYFLHGIPLYDGDVEAVGLPAVVDDFREKIRAADGVLIVSPEYNYGLPGVMKNALDWASRPPSQPFDKKPVAIMGASSGLFGTVKSQMQMRLVMQYLNAYAMPRPEYLLAKAQEKFDEQGDMTDEKSKELLGKFVEAAVAWFEGWKVRRLKG